MNGAAFCSRCVRIGLDHFGPRHAEALRKLVDVKQSQSSRGILFYTPTTADLRKHPAYLAAELATVDARSDLDYEPH